MLLEHKKLFFIGIGGIGMSGIAKIMLAAGLDISGSDLHDSSLLNTLRDKGAKIYIGHHRDNLSEDTDAVIFSSAVSDDNPELLKARAIGIPIYKRAAALDWLISRHIGIGIAGSHGKTTTSGMVSLMLLRCGLDPTVVIGGTLPQIESNARAGLGEYLVAEVDESDGTFLLLHPKIVLITNIEEDHMDYYKSLDDIAESFGLFIRRLPQDGLAVVNIDSAEVRRVMRENQTEYITCSLQDSSARFYAGNIRLDAEGSTADIYHSGRMIGVIRLGVPGRHNIYNALQAAALGICLGIPFADITDALALFSGTGRRFELLGAARGIKIIDDYAHHPTEIKATIEAARQVHDGRLICVFQPHRFTRTLGMKSEFGGAFFLSDWSIINEIYDAFETPIDGVSAELVVEEAKKLGNERICYIKERENIVRLLKEQVKSGDMVLVMGAGNIRSVGESLLRSLREM